MFTNFITVELNFKVNNVIKIRDFLVIYSMRGNSLIYLSQVRKYFNEDKFNLFDVFFLTELIFVSL